MKKDTITDLLQRAFYGGCAGIFMLVLFLPVKGEAQDLAQNFNANHYVPLNWFANEAKESVYKQKITVSLEEVSFERALNAIAEESNVRLSYEKDQLPAEVVTLSLIGVEVIDAFEQLLSGSRLEAFASSREQIIIKTESAAPEETELYQTSEVTGTVTDSETGETMPGVNVSVQGTNIGAATDMDGEYQLEIPGEDAVLVFSFVGYASQNITVGDQEVVDVELVQDLGRMEEVIVVGYGTVERSDMTGSVQRVRSETFQDQNMTQVTDMLTGTIAGFNANQATGPDGGSSLEVRGPNSLTAGTEPMIVLDGAIYNGNLGDINPADIETIDVLKDASSAAIFGAKAASGVILITTSKGNIGKPTINYSSRVGMTEAASERRPLNADEYEQFRKDYFRTVNPDIPYHFYTNPNELPSDVSLEEWRALSDSPQDDNTREYLSRLRFFPIEQEQYLAGETVDWYDVVMRQGIRQTHDLSISGGTDDSQYYWSLGYVDNEGVRVGQQYSAVRSRLNVDFQVVDWLSAGVNAQWTDRDESSVPASMNFYVNSPYGRQFDEEGNLERRPHGHSNHPLLNHYRQDRLTKVNSLFTNVYADVELPFGITHRVSFQPRYETMKDLMFQSTDPRVGGEPADMSTGFREEYSQFEWIVDNLMKWDREIGIHNFDVTLLHSVEESRTWATEQSNQNFSPNENLGYHGLHFGDNPSIYNEDMIVTGDALMARLNYTLLGKYLLTASIRRDGFSAFGQERPRANFPALALAWQISEEDFFNVDLVNQLKLRLSWGVNGNRDIGAYSALAQIDSNIWYDGTSTRIGVYNSTLANPLLAWEETESYNIGLDISLLDSRIDLTLDAYDMTTTNLLMNRLLPDLTGFSSVTANLGELQNRGFEMTLSTFNVSTPEVSWRSDFMFSLNRNKVVSLFGDTGEYTLLGETREGELPDYSNEWFPGRAIDAVWDYDVVGIWQEGEEAEAAAYGMRVGDFKAVDVNNDGVYSEMDDKQFIGHEQPRYRLGFRNEVSFLGNWTASMFIRADLGHIGQFSEALNSGAESNDRRSRNVGPVPYWTPENPSNEYARLDVSTSGYGGGLMIYKDRSFVRIQDVSLSYTLPSDITQLVQLQNLRLFASVRNLATFTDWPQWDPESGTTPMPRTYTLGLSLSL